MQHKNEKQISAPPRYSVLEWVYLGFWIQEFIQVFKNLRWKRANSLSSAASSDVQARMERFKPREPFMKVICSTIAVLPFSNLSDELNCSLPPFLGCWRYRGRVSNAEEIAFKGTS